MAEIRLTRVEQGQTKIRNVPIAVTPEGFWCCPSPVVFQKNLKPQNPLNKPKPFSPPHKTTAAATTTTTSSQKKSNPTNDRKSPFNPSRSASVMSDGQRVHLNPETIEMPPVTTGALSVPERVPKPPKAESLPRKVAIEFGEPRSSDMKLVLLGRQGFCVRLSVHRNVLADHSGFFAEKISGLEESGLSCLEIDDCEDVEIYVETVGLMYCKELKQRLIKQSVSRVLRILKVAELLGFTACMQSCLEYLEAVPWVGEDEEERVVSSVMRLQGEASAAAAAPILRRVSSGASRPPKDAFCQIIDLVLKSHDEKSRRDMKSVVLNLLRENNNSMSAGPTDDNINETMYSYCRSSLELLASEFRRGTGAEAEVARGIALESDNLAWLLEILAGRQAADGFAALWAGQREIAALHSAVPVVVRFHVSAVSARLFVGVGRGELLPPKDTRRLLLQTWLEPLIKDYAWLQHGCRQPFDRKLVEEGIGRTILTLPLDDQQSILLSWLGSFLMAGDNCPNLQRAFEVWWRRTFVRPYVEQQPQGNSLHSD